MLIKSTLKLGGKILLIALILQFIVAGSAFAFHNVDFSGGSTWFQDDSQNGNWWEDAWDDDYSPSQSSWMDKTVPTDCWRDL